MSVSEKRVYHRIKNTKCIDSCSQQTDFIRFSYFLCLIFIFMNFYIFLYFYIYEKNDNCIRELLLHDSLV